MTRELTRCIAWALGLGALAFAVALLVDKGLPQLDGVWAWIAFIVYAPYYLLVHLFQARLTSWHDDPAFTGAAVAAQLAWFFVVVAVVRMAWRRSRRVRR